MNVRFGWMQIPVMQMEQNKNRLYPLLLMERPLQKVRIISLHMRTIRLQVLHLLQLQELASAREV